MSILQTILTLTGLPAHQTRFLHALLSVWMAIPGRLNAINFSRYSGWSERTVRRWFHRPLPWLKLQLTLVQMLVQCGATSPSMGAGDRRLVHPQVRHADRRKRVVLEWLSGTSRNGPGAVLHCVDELGLTSCLPDQHQADPAQDGQGGPADAVPHAIAGRLPDPPWLVPPALARSRGRWTIRQEDVHGGRSKRRRRLRHQAGLECQPADALHGDAPEAARGTSTLGRQGRLHRLCRVDACSWGSRRTRLDSGGVGPALRALLPDSGHPAAQQEGSGDGPCGAVQHRHDPAGPTDPGAVQRPVSAGVRVSGRQAVRGSDDWSTAFLSEPGEPLERQLLQPQSGQSNAGAGGSRKQDAPGVLPGDWSAQSRTSNVGPSMRLWHSEYWPIWVCCSVSRNCSIIRPGR